MITLIIGGIKSGKSAFALDLCKNFNRKLFIATAQAIDEEIKQKIEIHKKQRGSHWDTIEEPVNLLEAIEEAKDYDIVLVDCLTMWINNLIYHHLEAEEKIEALIHYLKDFRGNIIFVTNEVGLGIIPPNALGRKYINLMGTINSLLSRVADEVYFVVSGIPIKIKFEKKGSYKHFSNTECEYYPCHKIENQNCLFCYCPLYFFDDCGGNFTYTNGYKDCSYCIKNHDENSFEYVLDRLKKKLEERRREYEGNN